MRMLLKCRSYDITAPNIYQYYSEAVFKQNQLITNFNARFWAKTLSLFGFYTLSFANSDSGGVNINPSNSADLKLDYGRAAFDVRNQMFLMELVRAVELAFQPFYRRRFRQALQHYSRPGRQR